MSVDPSIKTPPDTAGRKFYLAYLNSGSWRITRNRALREAGFRCSRCASKRNLQVHHKTYERLGREWDQDLEVVCADCHEQHHDVEKAHSGDSLRIYLKLVGLRMHDKSITTFSDLAEAVKKECAQLKIPYDSHRVGSAIALVAGKQKPHEPVQATNAELVESHEPLNKGEALRILYELNDQKRVVIRSMPGASLSAIDIYAPVLAPEWGEHDRY